MKRIIEGKTYNTETATCIAKQVLHHQDDANFNELYRTRHGAYFQYFGDLSLPADDFGFEEIRPLSPEEAKTWMERFAWAELIEEHFGEQPEAGVAERRLTFRFPDVLVSKIEGLAKAKNQSLNSWVMRCVEACSAEQADKTQ